MSQKSKGKYHTFFPIQNLLIVVLVLGYQLQLKSQTFYFTSFGVNDGMPSNVTNSIVQDQNGFIWIGTQEGLCRFDGHKMLIFKNADNATSISSNRISSLLLDDEIIWIGTWDGLSTISTTDFSIHRVNIGSSKAVRALYKDNNGNIWIGTSNGLIIYNKNTKSYQFFDTSNSEISHNTIRSFFQSKNGDMWIGTYDKINCYSNGKFSSFDLKGQYKPWLKNNLICTIRPFSDKNDTFLWVGTETGLCLLNTLNGTYKVYNSENAKLSNEVIKCIYNENDSILWLGTDFGLNLINTKTHQVKSYYHDPQVGNTISNNVIWEIFKDKEGQLWFVTSNGLSLLDNHQNLYQIHEEYYSLNNMKIGNQLRSMLIDKSGKKWIASIHGVICYDAKTGISRIFTDNDIRNRILLNNVYALEEDNYGRIWMGTAGGINIWDEKLQKMYSVSSNRRNGLSSNYINSFAKQKDGSIWLSAWEGGVFKVVAGMDNPSEMRFIKIDDNGDGRVINAGNHIFYGSHNDLWLIDLKTYEKTSIEAVNKCLKNKEISSIIGDSEDGIWIGAENLLLYYSHKTQKVKKLEINTGFQKKLISLQKDNEGNIWAATHNSILRINTDNYEYSTIPISKNSPLKSLNYHCAASSTDGIIYFGGDNGYIEINSRNISLPKKIPGIFVTNISINNQVISPLDSISILKSDISFCKSIILKHNQNSISFEFSTLDYLFPEVGQYAYRLIGFDSTWHYTPSGKNFAIFSNLSPDDYIFEVKGTDHFGVWSKSKSLNITIMPPLWLSKGFIFLYVVLFLGISYFIFKIIRYRRKLNHELRLAKLEKQHAEELFQAKQQFFTNISHEFRTPLSLILPPIQQVLKAEIADSNIRKLLKLANRNAQRLYKLVNQLLDFGKMESSKLNLKLSVVEIISFGKLIFGSFKDLARRHEINYQFNTNLKFLFVEVDTEKFEAILFNLLSNAFKYTPYSGSIELNISVLEEEKEQQVLVIRVTDSGMGIPENELDRIFERFYQTEESKALNMGSGIGLTMVQEYARLHNGIIKAESTMGKGSIFTLSLPVKTGKRGKDTDTEQIDSEITPIPAEYAKPETQAKSILIIDDNEDILDYIEMNLSSVYHVYRASNGKDGLEAAISLNPGLIISDVMMPVMDGIELCSKIKETSTTAHIPVILLTAKTLATHKTEAMKTGADMYITKPFDIEYFKSCVESIFRREEQLQAYIKNQLILNPDYKTNPESNQDEVFLKKVIQVIEENLDNPNLSVEMISDTIGLSSTHLYRRLKLITNQSTIDIIKNYRMQKAAQMILNNEGNISEIMYAVGFSSLSSFSKSFKSVFNVSPSVYGKQVK